MKQAKFKIGEKYIETPSLVIKKNIMTWDNTMIQLSNISYVSATNISNSDFPFLAAAIVVFGLFLLGDSSLLALAFLAVGAGWIYLWYAENERRKKGAILTIRMNSGHNLYFAFTNKRFLLQVLDVLERIIIDGGTHNTEVSINIENSTITGSKLLSEINR